MIKRVLHCLRMEFITQYRNGFFAAIGFVAVLWITLLRILPGESLLPGLALILMGNLMITAYYFLAGLILLDKNSGVLEAIVVTPLKNSEFIFCRLLALGILATAENLLVIWAGIGFHAIPLTAIPSLLTMALLFSLWGYLGVIKFDNISQFLMPSVVYTLLLLLAVIPWAGWIDLNFIWFHPLGPSLMWLTSSLEPHANTSSLDSHHPLFQFLPIVLSYIWFFGLFFIANHKHDTFVRRQAGD